MLAFPFRTMCYLSVDTSRFFLIFHVVNRAFNTFALENTILGRILYRLYDPALHTDEDISEQIQVDKWDVIHKIECFIWFSNNGRIVYFTDVEMSW